MSEIVTYTESCTGYNQLAAVPEACSQIYSLHSCRLQPKHGEQQKKPGQLRIILGPYDKRENILGSAETEPDSVRLCLSWK